MENLGYPKIALIGRVNVGKSSLFNRIAEKPKALVSKIPGTTRDRNYAKCEWRNKKFILIDLAGVEKAKADVLGREIQKQIKKAIEEANLILFIFDIQKGLINTDLEIAKMIRRSGKPTLLVLNKADNPKWRQQALSPEYWQLGFGQPWPVSAINGSGIGDLLDEIVKKLPTINSQLSIGQPIKVAIIGRPNVGKSSLLNALLKEERVIVSPIPHTTREPEDTLMFYREKPLLLIDTAGIRKKSKIKLEIERLGVEKSIKTIKKAEIVILVLDITEKISHQDKALVDLVSENSKGLILAINKIDLEKKFAEKFTKFVEYYQWNLPNASWAPIIFVSAKTGENVEKIFDLIWQVKENRKRKINKNELQNYLPIIINNKNFDQKIWSKIKLEQIKTKPPQFILKIPKVVARRKLIPQAQLNIIEKELRKKWHFEGTPIKISLAAK
ncbi:MAG: ribosome biogenesis GTPase Der [Patescibacteria group bacterium]